MLQVVRYYRFESLSQYLNESHKRRNVIVPNPKAADLFRSQLDADNGDCDVITINRFLSGYLNELEIERVDVRKSETVITLASAFHKGLSKDWNRFQEAYRNFSDLRGFTENWDDLSDLVAELGEQQFRDIGTLWKIQESLDLWDEQRPYSEVIKKLSIPGLEIEENAPISSIWGFKHLNGIQVDFFKELSKRIDVEILVREETWQNKKTSDFLSWLEIDSNQILIDLKENESEARSTKKRFLFPKRKLSQIEADTQEELKKVNQIVICDQNLDLNKWTELPFNQLFGKFPAEIFHEPKLRIFKSIERCLGIPLRSVANRLEKLNEEEMRSENFRGLKVVLTIGENLRGIMEYLGEEILLDDFIFQLLKDMTELDLPRVSLFSKGQLNTSIAYSLSDIEFVDRTKETLFLFYGAGKITTQSERYTIGIEKQLTSLGPIFRNDIMLNQTTSDIRNLIGNEKTIILAEEGVDEDHEVLNDIFKDFDYQDQPLSLQAMVKSEGLSLDENLDSKLGKLSATSAQSYYECPRKFAYQYVEKFQERTDDPELLRADQLGSLAHEILSYLIKKRVHHLDTAIVEEAVDKFLQSLLDSEKRDLSKINLKIYRDELLTSILSGLKYQEEIIKHFDARYVESEFHRYSNGNIPLNGVADVYFEFGEKFFLLDFKRSSFGIPNSKEFLEYRKMQGMFYYELFKHEEKSFGGFAFVCLTKPEDSHILFDDELKEELKILKKQLKFKSSAISRLELKKSSEAFRKELSLIWTGINSSLFPIKPLDEDACYYCPLNRSCSRGDRNG